MLYSRRFGQAIRAMVIVCFLLLLVPRGVAATPDNCWFTLGFATLSKLMDQTVGAGTVGGCVDDVRYNAAGNATQVTAHGAMYWRRADNWTGFTDGYRTWINGPYGLQARLNTERYPWELPDSTGDPGQKQDLTQSYGQAVRDAETAALSNTSTNLVPIVESNERLLWRGAAGKKQVLGVTWTGWPGYNGMVGQPMTSTAEVWISTFPEVKDSCQSQQPKEPTLRLEQLLGLPVANGKKWFVELWVSPQNLFRPSPDPEVTQQKVGLEFPAAVRPEHKVWFEDLRTKSYGENGYPWTRLGYTYDWGNPKSKVGPSEFVIRRGSPVEVLSVTATDEYCR